MRRRVLARLRQLKRRRAPAEEGFSFDTTLLAKSQAEADRRAERWRWKDPYPEIQPALLNTADLLDYVVKTGMIHPFDVVPARHTELLKPASCGIRVLGQAIWWEETDDPENPQRRERELRRDEILTLSPNSIVYVTLKPEFRLPNYIAARFNLTIRDIYRGLLVGTGPLVDPGFNGRLSLPLHNLTNNEYPIIGGEVLLWMEFTKLSPHPDWDESTDRRDRPGVYVEFPGYKQDRKTVSQYIDRAWAGPIRSSIPPLVGTAEQAARDAAAEARRIRGISSVGLLAAVAAIAALVIASYQLLNDVTAERDDLRRNDAALSTELRDEISDLRSRIRELERESSGR